MMMDTHRFLHFNLDHTPEGDEDNHYIDIGKMLSQANRRLYRQGMNYHIANIVFDDSDGDADIDVCTLPNTWTTQAAWHLGFKHWLAQQRAALESVEYGEEMDLGKWSDFKVALDQQERDEASDFPQLIDANGNTFPAGEWDRSHFIIANYGSTYNPGREVDINMMGAGTGTYPNQTVVSLLEELELVLLKPQPDPEFATDDVSENIWSLMSADQPNARINEEVLDNIEEENELPPYSRDVVLGAGTAGAGRPSSPWVARSCKVKGGNYSSAVGGFVAPCGLIMIETDSSTPDNSIGVTIELTPGDYKGVHAWPMRGGGY